MDIEPIVLTDDADIATRQLEECDPVLAPLSLATLVALAKKIANGVIVNGS